MGFTPHVCSSHLSSALTKCERASPNHKISFFGKDNVSGCSIDIFIASKRDVRVLVCSSRLSCALTKFA